MIIMDRWTAPNGRRFALAKFEMNENVPKHIRRFAAYKSPVDDASISAAEWTKFKRHYAEGQYVKAGTQNTDVFSPARVAGVQLWAIVSDPEPDINEFGRIEL